MIIVGERSAKCSAVEHLLHGRPFTGHVAWPKRCTLINPTDMSVMGVLTPDAAWGQAVCKLARTKGWIG